MKKSLIGVIVGVGLLAALGVGWGLFGESAHEGPALKVFKSATCGCCGDWADHMRRAGFHLDVTDVSDLGAVKARYGIDPRLQSCHTAVSDGGYVFEGHIPARAIKAFLEDPPEGARGLAVPGMPMGSPGMEMGRFTPFDVLVVNADGSASVFEHVDRPDYE